MARGPRSGFHKLPPTERIRRVAVWAKLTAAEEALLRRSFEDSPSLAPELADQMIENVVGVLGLPLGVATNFRVNGRDLLVPMAVEEPSVVAAASHGAKMALPRGGFRAEADPPRMVGQVHLDGLRNVPAAARAVLRNRRKVLAAARVADSTLERQGRGPQSLSVRVLRRRSWSALVVDIVVDVGDAMGANAVNTRCERVAPLLEDLTGGKARLRILSNLSDRRLARSRAVFDRDELGGPTVVEGILSAWKMAAADAYRCATHNKGILNGIDAVAVATGNDWRAVEAGAHAFAGRRGPYAPLTRFRRVPGGHLAGEIELPLALGTVGGGTRANPMASLSLKVLGVSGARELAAVAASVGLAQNVAALRALVSEGIQAGHMRLHRRLAR